MKVLILTDYFPPEVGGASHLMADVSAGLARRGHEVTVATGMPRYNLPATPPAYRRKLRVREDYKGARVIRTLGSPLYGRLPFVRGLSHILSGVAHFMGGLAAPKADVIFSLSPPLAEGVAGHFLRRLRGGVLVLNVQDIFPQNAIDLGVLRSRLAIRFFEAMERFVYRRADLVVVHSHGNRSFLVERKNVPPDKVLAVPNWVDTEALKPGPRENAFRREHGLDGRFVVTFAGVMGWSQGLDVIVDAAAGLSELPGVVVVFVGDGVEKARLEEKVRQMGLSNVRFLPMQPRERYALVLDGSDVCLVTLRPDVTTPVVPSKILSAMAAGRPVVASVPLEGDAPALIEEAGCGLSVPAGDGKALSAAIRRLYEDRGLALRMGESGRRAAETVYSLESCLRTYETLFERLMAAARGRQADPEARA